MRKYILVGGITLLSLVLLTGCGGKKDESAKINIGYFPSVSHAPAMVGLEKDFLRQELEGIKINTSTFANGSILMDALSLGQIDIGFVGPGPAINRFLQGGDVVALAGVSQGENVLVVRKDIPYKGPNDLQGKIVATPSTGCTHDLLLRKLLEEANIAVEENGGKVKRIVQKPATMIGLFQQKQIDAAIVSEPWASIMEAQGVVKVVLDANEVPWQGNLPATILVAKKSFVETHPVLVQKVLKANLRSIDFINKNRQETIEIVAKTIKSITNEDIEEETILSSMKRIEFTTNLDKETIQEFAELTTKLGFVEGLSFLDGFYPAKI